MRTLLYGFAQLAPWAVCLGCVKILPRLIRRACQALGFR